MLKDAIDLQKDRVEELVNAVNSKSTVTFKAPTGSGKTYMMADFMNRILDVDKDIVFLVSALSKSKLAEQNDEAFQKYKEAKFKNLDPYLISSVCGDEEGVPFIELGHNVYSLPEGLNIKGGKLLRGTLQGFLNHITKNHKIYLIKDECQIATTNLDKIAKEYRFAKIINFSATPTKDQVPDVEITEAEAVDCKLIKRIVLCNKNDTVEDALDKFRDIKKQYRTLLGINPCLIIQISNKTSGWEEWTNVIKPALDRPENADIKWMKISADTSECETNDRLGKRDRNGRLETSVDKWKFFAKKPQSTIDVIIFKLAITEGWDIPRACMLYQIRNTKSDTLDTQVLGRVRRNPRLMDFEWLSPEAQELAMNAWVWGDLNKNVKLPIKVINPAHDKCTEEIKIYTTYFNELTEKETINLEEIITSNKNSLMGNNIFNLHRQYQNSSADVKKLANGYINSSETWIDFCNSIGDIQKKINAFKCDYRKNLKQHTEPVSVSIPANAQFYETGFHIRITDNIWQRVDGNAQFYFDSQAESEWAEILKEVSSEFISDKERDYTVKTVKNNEKNIFLWGKNLDTYSRDGICFAYYDRGEHFSYPDFLLKDIHNRIHFFEVKCLDKSGEQSFDAEEYKQKILALKECYKYTSELTGYIFHIPILQNGQWQIYTYINGSENIMTVEGMKNFIKQKPSNI